MSLFGPPNIKKLKAKRDVKGLIKALDYQKGAKDATVRTSAATALGNLKDVRAVEPLIAALQDSDWRMRSWAAGSLGDIGDARAVEPLIAMLKDDEWFVRDSAANALKSIGDARAVEPLIAALKDDERFVRDSAANALKSIGGTGAQEALARWENEETLRKEKAPQEAVEAPAWKQKEIAGNTSTSSAVLDALASSNDDEVIIALSRNSSTSQDTLRQIFGRYRYNTNMSGGRWIYGNLILNPNCPTDILKAIEEATEEEGTKRQARNHRNYRRRS